MSSVLNVSKSLLSIKFKRINQVLLMMVIGILSVMFVSMFKQGQSLQGFIVLIGIVAYIFGLVVLVKENETVIVSNQYRLIPITTKRLYLSNLITTIVIYFYFSLIQSIILLSSLYYYMTKYSFRRVIIDDNTHMVLLIQNLILIILTVLVVFVVSTLIHLGLAAIDNFFAIKNQKAMTGIFNLLMTIFTIGMSYLLAIQMAQVGISRYVDVTNDNFLRTCLFEISGIVIVLLINLHLLENQVETEK
ncbi:hypothetical protein [Companilactobacillus sp. HBUAS59544]|uniref:hypothetical protein n=1 Tax=Companilactobacillus sp. HBUAS59544 TaxID=3109363 RepID=UPI002FF0537B